MTFVVLTQRNRNQTDDEKSEVRNQRSVQFVALLTSDVCSLTSSDKLCDQFEQDFSHKILIDTDPLREQRLLSPIIRLRYHAVWYESLTITKFNDMVPPDHLNETHTASVSPSIPNVPADGVVDAYVNTTEPDTDSCPTPLGWQQVLRTVRSESSQWSLNRNGYTIRGRTFGRGPPLYFLNGFGGTSDLFALLVWLLREEFRCVLFDYEDSFRYPLSGPRFSVEDLADDLFAVAHMQGDNRFSLYATSFGALVALKAMLHQPDRFERAVLQGGFSHRKLSLFEKMLARICCFVPGSYRHVPLRKTIQCWNHRRWFPPFDITRWQLLVDNTGSLPIATLARRASLLIKSDLRSRLSEIQQPVLLIRSEGEGMVSEQCHRELESGLMNKQTKFLNNCGHLPYLTHPHRLMKLILPFLQQQQSIDPCIDES